MREEERRKNKKNEDRRRAMSNQFAWNGMMAGMA